MVFCVQMGDDNVPFLQLGDFKMRLDLEDLNEDYKERAKNELRETPENVEYGLRRLREYLEDEIELNLPINDDEFLKRFLRPCKFYPDSSFKVLKKYYKFKLKHPKLGMNLTPNKVQHVFDEEVFFFLPSRSSCGSRILIINAGSKWNPKKVTLQDMFRAVMVTIEIAMIEPKTQVGGVHVIIDMQGFSLIHLYQLSPHLAKLIVEWVQECTPVRLKGIHIINQPYIFNMAYAVFKPFLGEKLKKRLFFHGANKNSLCEKISAHALPPYYGGEANIPQYPGRLLSEMLYFYEDMFELCNSYCYVREKVSTVEQNAK